MGTSKNNSKENLEINNTSLNIKEENLKLLKNIFPNVFSEDKLDIEKLKNLLGESVIDEKTIEKYSLSWAGKSDAFKAIRTPSTGTLIKDNKGVNEDNTENIFIEGDNLEVLKLLQKHYYNKIKMIYIDPPYNTGKDFVYKDNFTESVESYYEMTGQTEGGVKMTANTEKNGRFHSDWLTMMYPRLFLARNLLKDDGVIFISIDDNEVANLRLIMDEIFGEENFVATFIWNNSTGGGLRNKHVNNSHEYIILYAKNKINLDTLYAPLSSAGVDQYKKEDEYGKYREQQFAWQNASTNVNQKYPIEMPDGTKIIPKDGYIYRFIKESYLKLLQENKIVFKKTTQSVYLQENGESTEWSISVKDYLGDGMTAPVSLLPKEYVKMNIEAVNEIKELFSQKVFDYTKPSILIKYLIGIISDKDDIILDFFAGSGTTAHAVMDLNAEDGGNRKWICVQLPELTDEKSEAYKAGYKTISEISRERIKRAGEKIEKEVEEYNNTMLGVKALGIGKEKEVPIFYDRDRGFKTFSLAKSNYRKWNVLTDENTPEDVLKQAKIFSEKPLVDKYKEEDVVCEILLKEGFDLNSEIKKQGDIFVVVEKSEEKERKIFISFTKSISEKNVEKLKLTDDDTFVCFDSALTDTIKVNIVREVNLKVM